MKIFIFIFFCILFFSCGDKTSKSTPEKNISSLKPLKQESDFGTFRAFLEPVNAQLAGTTGKIEIKINNYEFIVKAEVENTLSGIKHFQYIMIDGKCPTNISDKNKDSIINFYEMLESSGQIILPLDSNLSEQFLGIDFGPIANKEGKYSYVRSAFFSDLFYDLKKEDPDPFDFYVKLGNKKTLALEDKIIVITGLISDSDFDLSFDNQGMEFSRNLPLACGNFKRIKEKSELITSFNF